MTPQEYFDTVWKDLTSCEQNKLGAEADGCKPIDYYDYEGAGYGYGASVLECPCKGRVHGGKDTNLYSYNKARPYLLHYSESVGDVLELVKAVGIKGYFLDVDDKKGICIILYEPRCVVNLSQLKFKTIASCLLFAVVWYVKMKEGE